MLTYVLASDGSPLMPTYNIRKVRHMLKDGRAQVAGHRPGFTIRLTYELSKQDAPRTQAVEFDEDTGKQHIGVSAKSEKHEFVHAQYDMLKNEKQRHDDRRQYRRMRRSRLRHRAARFDNRRASKKDGWLTPSIRNIKDQHERIFAMYRKVLPITDAWFEVGSFDTQLMEAIESGETIPEGKDYQRGKRYGIETLREAVFFRDNYTCQCCGKNSFADGKILRVHHVGYWKKPSDHTDRMGNMVTVCTSCHTAKNHKPGGKLYGWKPKIKSLSGAAFMNAVRWRITDEVKKAYPDVTVHRTYGARTKQMRRTLCISKSHANDAYCMGKFHPKHHAEEKVFTKRRRNSRVLSKFYDAKYIDLRTGEKKSGSQLSCGRTNRSEPRNGWKNERIYRGKKISSGRVSVRKKRYVIQPGTKVLLSDGFFISKGCQHYGGYVTFVGHKAVKASECKVILYPGAYDMQKADKRQK